MRLQKFLSSAGISSRRKAQEIIEDGRVSVNGEVIREKSFKVDDNDEIALDGKKLKISPKYYVVLNKPAGYLCTHDDKFGRKTIYDLVKIGDARLFSAGRLDYDSSGLIILTNDGDFANRITHPSGNIIKEYLVESFKDVPVKLVKLFLAGVEIDGEIYRAVRINKISGRLLAVFLHEGKKREIREVYKFFKTGIKSLKRVGIGSLKLKDTGILEGEYRRYERESLEDAIGIK